MKYLNNIIIDQQIPGFKEDIFKRNYNEIKGTIIFDVLPIEGNEAFYDDVLHTDFYDLFFFYKIIMDHDDDRKLYYVIKNSDLKRWGVLKEIIHQDAIINTEKNSNSFIYSFCSNNHNTLDRRLAGYTLDINHQKPCVAVFYPSVLKQMKRMFGDHYYVILNEEYISTILYDANNVSAYKLGCLYGDDVDTYNTPLSSNIYQYNPVLNSLELYEGINKTVS